MIDIMGTLTIVKQTIDITKDLRNIDEKIDAATWKLKLNEIIEKLIETKDALVDAKERERELIQEIEKLKTALNRRGRLTDQDGLLYEASEDGKRSSDPFCNQCYVKEERMYRLLFGPFSGGSHRCSNCNGVFGKNGHVSF